MLASATTLSGAAMIGLTVFGWLAACRLPAWVVRTALLFSLALFLPYFLLVPLIQSGQHEPGWRFIDSLVGPWSVLIKGISGMLVSIATIGCLTTSDLHTALSRMPLPRIVFEILVQIVHQTGTLIYETSRIASAMSVRGATGSAKNVFSMLWSLPRVWLPRVIARAERVAMAMELREYRGNVYGLDSPVNRFADIFVLVLMLTWLAAVVIVRYWGPA